MVTRRRLDLAEVAGASYDSDLCGDLAPMIEAARRACLLYLELEAICERTSSHSEARAALRTARETAYALWRQIERDGAPLLAAYERDTLGYAAADGGAE